MDQPGGVQGDNNCGTNCVLKKKRINCYAVQIYDKKNKKNFSCPSIEKG